MDDGGSHQSDVDREILLGIFLFYLFGLMALLICHVCKPSREHSDHAGQPLPPPVVCTYLRADGWRDGATCGVCLEDLADGDPVTLLQPCMHCFHAACGSRWIRHRATCPLCRAPVADDDGTVLPA